MPSTPPGMELYSDEWFDAYGTNVPEPLHDPVRRICEGYFLGNTSDPNLLAEMILDGIKKDINKYIMTNSGVKRIIKGVVFRNDGIFYVCRDGKLINTDNVFRISNVTE